MQWPVLLRTGLLKQKRNLNIHYCTSLSAQTSTQKDVREVKIPVPWGHISGKWWGPRNVKPVIGLHGWQDNAGTFDCLAPLLNTSFLAIDIPGHGLSSWYPAGSVYKHIDIVMCIRGIVKHFNWDTVSFLGHSLGSLLAFTYSGIFPDQVEKYIGIECTRAVVKTTRKSIDNSGSVIDKFLALEKKIGENVPAYTYEEALELLYEGSYHSSTKESCEILLKRGLVKSAFPNKYHFSRDPRLRLGFLGSASHQTLLELASKIKCEVLSINGVPGLDLAKDDTFRQTSEIIKKCAVKYLHFDVEGTHHLHLNNPELVAPIINEFLENS